MVTELETKTENVWMQKQQLVKSFKKKKVAKTSWWQKRCGGKNVTWD
jgi:hypothetical protein